MPIPTCVYRLCDSYRSVTAHEQEMQSESVFARRDGRCAVTRGVLSENGMCLDGMTHCCVVAVRWYVSVVSDDRVYVARVDC